MKTILTIIAIFIMTIGFASTTTMDDFTKAEIIKVEDIFVNKDVKAIWTISYSENETPVTVIKHKVMSGVEYVVHSKYFDVTYASTSVGFGIIDTRRSNVIVHKKITKSVINETECNKQAIITPNNIDDETAVGLISAYLPELINDSYSHLLN